MTQSVYHQSRRSRLGEVALWSTAALLTLFVHAGAAYYIMHEAEQAPADGAPPAAIMIEMAALPEAVNTESTVDANDQEEAEEVKTSALQPVDEPPPEEPPEPQPVPEPVAQEPPPEPPREITEPLPEEMPPEPVQEVDPVEQQQMAALENVEVPLPVLRPPPPPAEKKVEKKVEEDKKKQVQKPSTSQQASERRDVAKAEAMQSNRTAAARTSAGLFSSSMSPADWSAKVRSAVSRRVARGIGTAGTSVTVSFVVADNGSIGRVNVVRSTGDASVDQKIVASIEKVSMSSPPPGAQTAFEVPIAFSSRR